MEDRITPGLYLEMTELTPDEYAARRVADVLALAEVELATWRINVKRDREDLPRVLPEFDTLGVYEVGERFVAPETPWLHLDMMAWNGSGRPGRPEGGEATGLRALYAMIAERAAAARAR